LSGVSGSRHGPPQPPDNIGRLVRWAAESYSDADAVVDVTLGRRVSFTELAALVQSAASLCLERGVAPGDRVAIWAPNSLDWVVAALGAVSVGAALVPLNTRFKSQEAAWILDRAGATTVFVSPPFLGVDYAAMAPERIGAGAVDVVVLDGSLWQGGDPGRPDPADVSARIERVRPDDVSDIIFTSGTTGRPKGVVTSHHQTIRVFATWAEVVGLHRGDRYLVVNPFFHTFGYKAGVIACLLTGAAILPLPTFDLAAVVEVIEAERVTTLPGPPTIYGALLDLPDRDAHDLSSLRLTVTGAAVVPVSLVERMQQELKVETVLTAYGLTEATGTVTMCRRGDDPVTIATTSGRAIPDTEVRIVDPDNRPVAAGETGEVTVRGYNVMSGYFEDPVATAAVIDAEGWLHTGDVGSLDPDGNLRITDRLKDMYVVGGFNAYPAEIEQAMSAHPGISEVAVIGVADARLGEVGKAFVVPRDGADIDEADVIAWCRDRMANYKVPRSITVVDALPRNASGKVLKTELRR
jgi:acyl-CoA synthetase (AMP-forming)/AMP-acid ligase II